MTLDGSQLRDESGHQRKCRADVQQGVVVEMGRQGALVAMVIVAVVVVGAIKDASQQKLRHTCLQIFQFFDMKFLFVYIFLCYYFALGY